MTYHILTHVIISLSVLHQFWNCAEVRITPDCEVYTTTTSTLPAATSPTSSNTVCVAYTQEELDARGQGGWHTSDEQCGQCGPPTLYPHWPCNANPTLCNCEGIEPVSTQVASTTSSTMMTTTASSTTTAAIPTTTGSTSTGSASVPTANPTPNPTNSPVFPSPPSPPTGYVAQAVYDTLEQAKERIDSELFLYETPTSQWVPSTVYKYLGMMGGIEVMHEFGVAGTTLYLGDDSDIGHQVGLVSIAAFLAQSMKETIKYDACDENS